MLSPTQDGIWLATHPMVSPIDKQALSSAGGTRQCECICVRVSRQVYTVHIARLLEEGWPEMVS